MELWELGRSQLKSWTIQNRFYINIDAGNIKGDF